jgi:hypothetical protein
MTTKRLATRCLTGTILGLVLVVVAGFCGLPVANAQGGNAAGQGSAAPNSPIITRAGSVITEDRTNHTPVFTPGPPVFDGAVLGPGDYTANAIQWQLRNESGHTVLVKITGINNANAGDRDNGYRWFDEGLRNSVAPVSIDPFIAPMYWHDTTGAGWSGFSAYYAAESRLDPDNLWDWQKRTTFRNTGAVSVMGTPIWEVSGERILESQPKEICLEAGHALNSYLSSGVDYRVRNEFQGTRTLWSISYSGKYAEPGQCGIPDPPLTDSGEADSSNVGGNMGLPQTGALGFTGVFAAALLVGLILIAVSLLGFFRRRRSDGRRLRSEERAFRNRRTLDKERAFRNRRTLVEERAFRNHRTLVEERGTSVSKPSQGCDLFPHAGCGARKPWYLDGSRVHLSLPCETACRTGGAK